VQITAGYWMAETACTQALWKAVTGESPSSFEGDNLPVESISWDDIHERFLPTLSDSLEDLEPRLPTDAEWEYACRAGTSTPFSFGTTITTEQANYSGAWEFGEDRTGTFRGATTDVEMFDPNAWGLFQMHGNVLEWCSDWYSNDKTDHRGIVDPQGPKEGQRRVLRGGSWSYDGRLLRSAFRIGYEPGFRHDDVGFRLAQVPR